MPEHTVTPTTSTTAWKHPKPWPRTVRWVASFVGFPLGGLAAMIVVGPVASTVTAVAGGLLTGAVLGTAQAAGLGLRPWMPIERAEFLHWIAATAVGLGLGLGIGATAVGFDTSLPALVVQGAISGLAVGAAQAVVLRRRVGALALGWPPALAAFWAVGWFITTSVGVQVEEQFTVFGAAGAITVTLLTTVLPKVLAHRAPSTTAASTRMGSSS